MAGLDGGAGVEDRIESLETGHYGIRLHHRDPDRLVVVFASAGARRVDGFAEEFRSSFWPTGCSMLFVTERPVEWYNHFETEAVFDRIAAMTARYRHVGAIGESMGACGAILFSNFAAHLDRVLAISPQYSIFGPYIRFDPTKNGWERVLPGALYEDFSRSPMPERIVLIYGNLCWEDHLHASMYEAAGFASMVIDGSPHEVARHLKETYPGNLLARLAALFADFSQPFTRDMLRRDLAVAWTERRIRPDASPTAGIAAMAAFNRLRSRPIPIPVVRGALLSAGCAATQSSVSAWSLGADREADAAGLVDGMITAGHRMHTAAEPRPWWAVDLGRVARVAEIRVFNRIDQHHAARRAYDFRLELSEDSAEWWTVLDKRDGVAFGGADGRPYMHAIEPAARARFVRLSLNRPEALSLVQVQVFGPAEE